MTTKFPMTLVAQLDDVAVFQTSAFHIADSDSMDFQASASEDMQLKQQQIQQLGQVSYGDLNVGLHVNDDAAQVLSNRMRVLTAINKQLTAQKLLKPGLAINHLHWVNQVHGQCIYDVDSMPLGMQPLNADAMVSQKANVGLAIMTADCVPIVLYQPASGQIAAIHAGWQGLACGVIKATAERFDSDAGQIIAWIGVCISQESYEVNTQVRDKLLAGCVKNQLLTPTNTDDFNQRYCMAYHTDTDLQYSAKKVGKLRNLATVSNDRLNIDLPKLAADQLIAADIGVNTQLPVTCSYKDKSYYSYRRQTHLQQPATGRMALIVVRSSANSEAKHH